MNNYDGVGKRNEKKKKKNGTENDVDAIGLSQNFVTSLLNCLYNFQVCIQWNATKF